MPDMSPHRYHILVVEDDATLARLLSDQIARLGYGVSAAGTLAAAREELAEGKVDLMLVDMNLPDADGFGVLEVVAGQCPVIFMTAFATVDQAVKAVHSGAVDYLVKPVSGQTLELALHRAMSTAEMERDLRYWQGAARRGSKATIIGDSPQSARMRSLIDLYAPADSPVLICGEGGTGKEMIARLIHDTGPRQGERFVVFDCEAPDEAVAERELFGVARGAADGDDASADGVLEMAAGGTVYLNDIADLRPRLQAKVLRVLESGTFRRVGGKQLLPLRARIIAASRHDLGQQVADGAFRSELYYRLNAFEITVPALRERREDIAILAGHFLQGREFLRDVAKAFDPRALKLLSAYAWPGNVRELRNVIERGVIMSASDTVIVPDHLALPGAEQAGQGRRSVHLSYDQPPSLEALREDYVQILLDRYDGNRQKVAQTMGISERSTYRIVRKLKAEGRLDQTS